MLRFRKFFSSLKMVHDRLLQNRHNAAANNWSEAYRTVLSRNFPAALFENRAHCRRSPIIGHLSSSQSQIEQVSQRFRNKRARILRIFGCNPTGPGHLCSLSERIIFSTAIFDVCTDSTGIDFLYIGGGWLPLSWRYAVSKQANINSDCEAGSNTALPMRNQGFCEAIDLRF